MATDGSTAALRAAWETPGFEKGEAHNYPGEWIGSDYQAQDTKLRHDERAPPYSVMPAESRFVVDYDAQWVEWMDFSFYVSFSRDTGVRLFDIKYKGQRVMYELGLEEVSTRVRKQVVQADTTTLEAIAHYAGNDPVQSGTSVSLQWLLCSGHQAELLSFTVSRCKTRQSRFAPAQTNKWSQTFYGFGPYSFALLPGYE